MLMLKCKSRPLLVNANVYLELLSHHKKNTIIGVTKHAKNNKSYAHSSDKTFKRNVL